VVSLVDGKLQFQPLLREKEDPLPFSVKPPNAEEGLAGRRRVQRVEDGWLVGFDAGEFGGALWWFNSDGTSRKKLAGQNIVSFMQSPSGILVLAGLAHLGMSEGVVLRVMRKQGEWYAVHFARLDGAPETSLQESTDSFIVLTTKSFLRVKASGVVEKLYEHKYDLLHPNSMTQSSSGVIYVGMRHFVTRLTPINTGYKEEWLVPSTCKRFEKLGFDCVCMAEEKR